MNFAILKAFRSVRLGSHAVSGIGCVLIAVDFAAPVSAAPVSAAPRAMALPVLNLPFLPSARSATAATSVVISEFRTSGPAGDEDSYVELFNATDAPVPLAGWTLKYIAADGQPVSVTFPEKTIIPVSGHFLFTGRGYSLKAVSPGDAPLPSAIAGGLQLCDADDRVCDAAGPRRATAGFREGAGLADSAFGMIREQYSCVRKAVDGTPSDSDSNERDFEVVSVAGKIGPQTVRLGAPGPQGLASPASRRAPSTYISTRGISVPMPSRPVQRTSRRDGTAAKVPGRSRVLVTGRSMVRDLETRGDGQAFGTLTVRIAFTNRTGTFLKPLDFVVQSITCGPARQGVADIHLLRSSALSAKGGKTVARSFWNAALVEPPAQPGGGGLNATARLGLPAGGIGPGASGEAVFVFGVERIGRFRAALGSELLNLVFEGDTETPWRDLADPALQAATAANLARLAMSGVPGHVPGGAPGTGVPGGPGIPMGTGGNAGGGNPVLTASLIVEGNTNMPFDDPVSSIRLSAINADDNPGVIRLTFTGALDAHASENAGRYKVQINGAAAGIEKVAYDAVRSVVSLFLSRGTLHVGDRVLVQWSGLQDAKGLILAGQAGPVTVK